MAKQNVDEESPDETKVEFIVKMLTRQATTNRAPKESERALKCIIKVSEALMVKTRLDRGVVPALPRREHKDERDLSGQLVVLRLSSALHTTSLVFRVRSRIADYRCLLVKPNH